MDRESEFTLICLEYGYSAEEVKDLWERRPVETDSDSDEMFFDFVRIILKELAKDL